jgi:threonine dehydrogenase-like Zn-dependent dehydrogenase
MRAIAFFQEEDLPRVVERDRPNPTNGEVLIRIRQVGIDGTDRRIVAGELGEFPDSEDHLILGHEAVGVVADSNGTDLDEGQAVVPTVRRPLVDGDPYFKHGEPDMAPPDTFVECGIFGAHGFMAEYAAISPEHLVAVPDDLSNHGFLAEPMSVCEKALDQAMAARSAFAWEPESALVLGTGSLGLLALARLVNGDEFERVYCLGRRDRTDRRVEVIDQLGATYIDSRKTPVTEMPDAHEAVDFVYEGTGYPLHAYDAVSALAANGVATLQGVPESRTAEIDLGAFHRNLVTANKALLGVVNARRNHFEAAVDTVAALPDWFVDRVVTEVYDPANAAAALTDEGAIKTAITFER